MYEQNKIYDQKGDHCYMNDVKDNKSCWFYLLKDIENFEYFC